MIFLDPFCCAGGGYISTLAHVRRLLERNMAVITGARFKNLELALPPATRDCQYSNWTSSQVMREERLLQEICDVHNVELSKSYFGSTCLDFYFVIDYVLQQ